jgi:hypothetical protein
MRKFLIFTLAVFFAASIPASAQTVATDSLAGTAGTTLEAHTSGGVTWVRAAASTDELVIRAGGGVRQTATNGATSYAATSPATATADYYVTGTFLPQTAAANNVGVGVRVQSNDADGYYAIYQTAASSLGLFRVSGNGATFTPLGSYTFTETVGSSITISVGAVGTALTVQLNGSTVISGVSDSTYATGIPGVNMYSSGDTDSTGWAMTSFSYTNGALPNSGGGSFTLSAAANDSSFLYSPWNWAQGTYTSGTYAGKTYAAAVNPGAYIRQQYQFGTSAVLHFDVTNLGSFNAADIPHIAVRVDNGPFVKYSAATSVDISSQLNSNTSTGQNHLIEILFNSVQEATGGQERFNVVSGTGVVAPVASLIFLGTTYNSGATWSAPPRRKYNVLLDGDSITEGADAQGNSTSGNSYPGTNNDASAGWAFNLAQACDAEVGVVGFSGQAVANTLYYVHNALYTYASVYQGVPRNFASPTPDAVGLDWGTNDGASAQSDFVAGIQTIHSTIATAAPHAKFFMWEDYRAQQTPGEVAAMSAIGGKLITGLLDGGFMTNGIADSYDGNHPTATTHATKMLPVISSAVCGLLSGSRTPTYF